jgi:anthranilate phosphoribosyltransferase
VTEIEIAPEDIGVPRAAMSALKGGDAEHNARRSDRPAGQHNAFRDIVVLNSAAP